MKVIHILRLIFEVDLMIMVNEFWRLLRKLLVDLDLGILAWFDAFFRETTALLARAKVVG